MQAAPLLVTGGAGYIGSHVVRQLSQQGREVIVLDDLSTGHAGAVGEAQLVIGEVGDRALVERLLTEHRITSVLHFAGHLDVSASLREPLRYYGNNVSQMRNLLAGCQQAGVRRFIYSSTAAVYGRVNAGIARESDPPAPITPYGRSKLVGEWMLSDLAAASTLHFVTLRYFNVAGAAGDCELGPQPGLGRALVKVCCEAAAGLRPHVEIFGTDYDTPDGTGVRDYIHVEDLARAHLDALVHLESGGESVTLNCGYGHGTSVREVIDAVERVTGQPLATREMPRRPGDLPHVVADAHRIRDVLGWRPRYDNVEEMIRTALAWECRQLEVSRP